MSETTLFSELDLGHTKIKNRTVMGSMHTGLEEHRNGFERLAEFYAARAKGGAGLIITGGFSPNLQGRLHPLGSQLSFPWQLKKHRLITNAVHQHGAKICLQILHAGRYSYHPLSVSSSSSKSPITPFKSRGMTKFEIKKTIKDFARTAHLAKKAGYDGVEIMGSEGYLLNQFLVPRTNHRKDQYGGDFQNRKRIVLEILDAIRKKVGPEFIIVYRLSLLDLVSEGSTFQEVLELAKDLETHGVDIINSGIGWHEARIPTIATMVPRMAFTWITEKVKKHTKLPIIATNRINNAEDAKHIIQNNIADMISMARPFLADENIIQKIEMNKADEINTCIACNQACLDHIFADKLATCLVNPKACHEVEFKKGQVQTPKKLAVIGAGPAGLSFAIEAAKRGHEITIFEANSSIGGQFNIAKEIPGKEEFKETIRYFNTQLKELDIALKLNFKVELHELEKLDFDEYIFSTGVTARTPQIPGVDLPHVISYTDLLLHKKPVGHSVAVIGAGGIGFDACEYLAHSPHEKSSSLDRELFLKEWGIDTDYEKRGAIKKPTPLPSTRKIYLLQRKETKHGKNLGKTTGWIHRKSLKNKNVEFIGGISYKKIDSDGLWVTTKDGDEKHLKVDHIVICAGQESNSHLYEEASRTLKKPIHLIGGAYEAHEIDAKRAINQGVRLANQI